jgi:predicted nucleic acid-binding protein
VADHLVDTDIFVDHLRGARRLLPGDQVIWYSVVTRAELFAGRGSDEARVAQLLGPFRELPVSREVAERAGRLRREHALPLADALVAAMALEYGLGLVTRKERDFRRVPGLVLVPVEVVQPA